MSKRLNLTTAVRLFTIALLIALTSITFSDSGLASEGPCEDCDCIEDRAWCGPCQDGIGDCQYSSCDGHLCKFIFGVVCPDEEPRWVEECDLH
jgi:hypothetical protein